MEKAGNLIFKEDFYNNDPSTYKYITPTSYKLDSWDDVVVNITIEDGKRSDICSDAFYFVDDEKDDYFVFKDFVDNKERYNVSKSSIELSKTTLIPGETLVSSILFKYGKYWYHNGVMINYSIR